MKNFKNDKIIIQTPKGRIAQRAYTKGRYKGKIYLRLEWAPGFGPKWTKALHTVQAMFDTEVLRTTTPYVPMDTEMLRLSAQLASDIGGGELVWATPYAASQYYNTADYRPYSSLAGAQWGERSKADNLSHYASFAKGAVKKVGK